MPVFNGCKYLRGSLGSVLSQSFRDWEIIALDDGSADGSYNLLQAFAEKDCRIRVFHQENDGKGNTARNLSRMIPYASGEFCFYMSQDDELDSSLFETAMARAEETDADVVIPDMMLKYADGTLGQWACSYPPGGDHNLVLSGQEAFYLATDFQINGFAFIRRRLMADGRNDTRFFDSDEYNTKMQYLWANRVAFCASTFYYFRGNPEAMTVKFSPARFDRLPSAQMLAEAFFREFPERERRLKIYVFLMRMYIMGILLYFDYYREMETDVREVAKAKIKDFERHVRFDGFRLRLLSRLDRLERVYAMAYFIFGSCRRGRHIYYIYRKLRRLVKGV